MGTGRSRRFTKMESESGPFFRHGAPPQLQSPIVSFIRIDTMWKRSDSPNLPSLESRSIPQALELRQDYNTPPRLYALGRSARSRELFDLAPFAHEKSLGTVEMVKWSDAARRQWRGLLVLPANYHDGQLLPLILQTHVTSTTAPFLLKGRAQVLSRPCCPGSGFRCAHGL